MYIDETKPEKANVFITKIISQYETQVVNTVDYNENKEQMYLDAVMQEVHNYDEDDREVVLKYLKEADFDYFNDGHEITLVLDHIEPFNEKQLDRYMFITIKYPAI